MTASNLVWTVNVGVFASLASPLCFAVKQDGRSGLGVTEEVDSLNGATHDELNPEDPTIISNKDQSTVTENLPRQRHPCLDECANDSTHD
jgi:hypothetical protein